MNLTINGYKLIIIITAFIVGGIILYSNRSDSAVTHPMEKIIRKQFSIYPEMKTQDLYKFIHQAAMGSEHAVKNPASAKKWMEDEIAGMSSAYYNDLYDTLAPGGKLVRVNLRPYLKSGYDPDLLVNAFVSTANNFKGSFDTLKYFWSIALKLSDRGEIPLNRKEMISFIKEKESLKFPAVHHSELYNNLYHPAYRVVAKEYLGFINKE